MSDCSPNPIQLNMPDSIDCQLQSMVKTLAVSRLKFHLAKKMIHQQATIPRLPTSHHCAIDIDSKVASQTTPQSAISQLSSQLIKCSRLLCNKYGKDQFSRL